MDWHPIISVLLQTPDNDFCHFGISNVRFAFGHFFRKPGKPPRVSHRVKMITWWPGRERWPKWPIDPVTQWPSSMSSDTDRWRPNATPAYCVAIVNVGWWAVLFCGNCRVSAGVWENWGTAHLRHARSSSPARMQVAIEYWVLTEKQATNVHAAELS